MELVNKFIEKDLIAISILQKQIDTLQNNISSYINMKEDDIQNILLFRERVLKELNERVPKSMGKLRPSLIKIRQEMTIKVNKELEIYDKYFNIVDGRMGFIN